MMAHPNEYPDDRPRPAPVARSKRQRWEQQAAAVLKKVHRLSADAADSDVWEALTTTSVEEIRIPVLGLPGRLEATDGRRRSGPGGWKTRPYIVDPDPAQAADAVFDEWRHDATSIWLAVGSTAIKPSLLGRALARVPLESLPLVVSAVGSTTDVQAAQAMADVLGGRGIKAAPGSSLGADPVGRLLRTGSASPGSAVTAVIRDVAMLANDLGTGALVADGTVAHRMGAGDAAEVGYTLATAVHYLRALEALGHPIGDTGTLLELRLAATDDQFATIAKFRAARMLWTRIGEVSGGFGPVASQIHAVTSDPMMTGYDPFTNLLRTTIAAFAAGVGGAESLTVQSFDVALGIPTSQGMRLARNISALLAQESHVADVADPAGGAGAVEELTDTLADAAWKEFQLIELAGGVTAAVDDGSVRSRIDRTRIRRRCRIDRRAQPITGISMFPKADEVLLVRRPYPASPPGLREAQSSSWAADFETLRGDPIAEPVFLATLGTIPASAPRAGFAADAFAAGGVGTTPAVATANVDDVRAAFAARPSAVVCLAGSDAAYEKSAAEVVSTLRAAGARWFILTGGRSPAIASLFDDHLAAGDDILAFLLRTRQAFGSPVRTISGASV